MGNRLSRDYLSCQQGSLTPGGFVCVCHHTVKPEPSLALCDEYIDCHYQHQIFIYRSPHARAIRIFDTTHLNLWERGVAIGLGQDNWTLQPDGDKHTKTNRESFCFTTGPPASSTNVNYRFSKPVFLFLFCIEARTGLKIEYSFPKQ